MKDSSLRLFGRVQRRDEEFIGKRKLKTTQPGCKRTRKRPNRRYMNGIKEVEEKDA